jgi:hypothetical protein
MRGREEGPLLDGEKAHADAEDCTPCRQEVLPSRSSRHGGRTGLNFPGALQTDLEAGGVPRIDCL